MTYLKRVPHPMSMTDEGVWAVQAEAELWRGALVELVGDDDLAETVPLLVSYGINPGDAQVLRIVASDSPDPTSAAECTGVATLTLPMAENLTFAESSIVVRSDRRREGIGTALLADVRALAREHGRTTVSTFTAGSSQLPEAAELLRAGTGPGAVAAEAPSTRFLLKHGFRLNQVERVSRLVLPSRHRLTQLRDTTADGVAEAYECFTLFGPTPPELADACAALRVAMSTDVPTGDVQVEAEAWDAARLARSDAAMEVADREQLHTYVRQIPDGRLVAFTRLLKDRIVEAVAHQWETLVVREHRGHGLGMLCKTVNHAAISQHWPSVRSVITGNASENRHMLDINKALGFEAYALEGYWVTEDGAHT